jgi:hypothetical protein
MKKKLNARKETNPARTQDGCQQHWQQKHQRHNLNAQEYLQGT